MYKILVMLLVIGIATPAMANFRCHRHDVKSVQVLRGIKRGADQNVNVTVVQQQTTNASERDRDRDRGGGWNHNPGWGHGPSSGEVIGGLIIGNAISNWLFPPKPVVVIAAPPPPPVEYRPAAWSQEWFDSCNGKYKSFDAKTGYWTGYDGNQHFCMG